MPVDDRWNSAYIFMHLTCMLLPHDLRQYVSAWATLMPSWQIGHTCRDESRSCNHLVRHVNVHMTLPPHFSSPSHHSQPLLIPMYVVWA